MLKISMINVGVIGTGFGAKIHIPGWQSLPGIKVLGLAGKNYADTKKIAQYFKIERVFYNWQDLVCDPDIAIVSVVTPPHLHADMIIAAWKNKKAVLTEKPLCHDLIDSARLLKEFKKNKLLNAINFELRYLPVFKKLKTLLQSKLIGDLRSITVNLTTGGRANAEVPLNWSNYSRFGGGVLANYGSHVIDYLEWLMGPITQVSAQLTLTKKTTYPAKPKPTAEDAVFVNFILKNGTPGSIVISNVVYGGEGQRLSLYGSKGTLILHNPNIFDFARGFRLTHIDSIGNHININTPELPTNAGTTYSDGRLAPFIDLATDFIKCFKQKQSFSPDINTGVRVQRVLAAIQQSNRQKKLISIK